MFLYFKISNIIIAASFNLFLHSFVNLLFYWIWPTDEGSIHETSVCSILLFLVKSKNIYIKINLAYWRYIIIGQYIVIMIIFIKISTELVWMSHAAVKIQSAMDKL